VLVWIPTQSSRTTAVKDFPAAFNTFAWIVPAGEVVAVIV
jgi:hypothetical protein